MEWQGFPNKELPFFKVGDLDRALNGRDMMSSSDTISREDALALRASVLPASAIVYAKIGAALLLNRRRVLAVPACIDNNMTGYIPNSLRATYRWAHLALSQLDFARYVNPGAVPSLSEGVQSTLPIPLPPLPEQRAIVRYLDYMDRRIRRYVDAKRRLIALLEEERQAIVNHAVTRGLDPNVRLKPSGVEWLGDVPEHWEVRRLKHWVGINETVLPETTEPDLEFRYVDIGAVSTGVIVSEPVVTRFGGAPSRARRVVRTGDTIVSTVRTYLKATWFAEEVKDDMICSTGFAVLTPRKLVPPKFVSYLVQSNAFTDRITAVSAGTAYPAIAESRLGSFHVALPPLPEQRAIVEYLDKATSDIDAAIARARRQVELVEEYRARLIADVVTGTLDVREAAAALPEEVGYHGPVEEGSPMAEEGEG